MNALEHCLIDEFETPDASSQPFDIEQVKTWKILDPAELDDEFDFVSAIHAVDHFVRLYSFAFV